MTSRPTKKTSHSEKVITQTILKDLKLRGGFWYKTHGSPYQRVGIPDIIGCFNGRMVGIEVKRKGQEPTTLQWETLRAMERAGACVGVAHSRVEALLIINKVWEAPPNYSNTLAIKQ